MIYWKGRRECRRTLTGAVVFDRDGKEVARVQNREEVLAILTQYPGKTFELYLKQWADFPPPEGDVQPDSEAVFIGSVCMSESGTFQNDHDEESCWHQRVPAISVP